jgi:PleD family two-component response regulator
VNSTPGQGSAFHFTARFAPGTAAVPDPAGALPPRPALAGLRGADILLVEDTELNQEVTRAPLEQAGVRVRLAINLERAVSPQMNANERK